MTHETGGTICFGHWVLCLEISHTRHGVRFVTGIELCVLGYHTRDRSYDLLRALGSASCANIHETGGTICYGHWVLRLVILHTRQGVRFVTAMGSASRDITHETRGTICYGHWVLRLVILHTRQGVRLLRALGSVSCDITHETEARASTQVLRSTICCRCLGLELVPKC